MTSNVDPAVRCQETGRSGSRAMTIRRHSGHEGVAGAELDTVTAVTVARLALQQAHVAVLKTWVARVDAGEAEPGAEVVDGHTPPVGPNAVSRHGPALPWAPRRNQLHSHPRTAFGGP
jgi:hypothetical protein